MHKQTNTQTVLQTVYKYLEKAKVDLVNNKTSSNNKASSNVNAISIANNRTSSNTISNVNTISNKASNINNKYDRTA